MTKKIRKDHLQSVTYENPVISHRDFAIELLAGAEVKKAFAKNYEPILEELKDTLNVVKKLWHYLESPGLYDSKRLDMSQPAKVIYKILS